jgi:hypothetical protein
MMFDMLDELNYQGKPVKEYKYYAMGQICVAEGYRGQGIFDGMYACIKSDYLVNMTFVLPKLPKEILAH